MDNENNENINSSNDTVSEDRENETTLTSEDESVVETEETSKEDVVDVGKLQEANAKLYARAKKAEARLKELEKNKSTQDISKEANFITRDEALLIARGYDDELLGQAKKIAKANGIPLSEIEKDEVFLAYKEKREREIRNEKAKLSTSKGSGSRSEKQVSDMTAEEHKDFWRKKMGL